MGNCAHPATKPSPTASNVALHGFDEEKDGERHHKVEKSDKHGPNRAVSEPLPHPSPSIPPKQSQSERSWYQLPFKITKHDSKEEPENLDNRPPPRQETTKNMFTSSWGIMCFGTRRILVEEGDRKEYIRATLLELSIYLLFLVITCMITYGTLTPSSFYYNSVVSQLFLNTPFGNDSKKTFTTSRTVGDFWKFAETTMVNGLYWRYWYDEEESEFELPEDHIGVLYENKLLGRPRLRQIRVSSVPCPISENFRKLHRTCYPHYSPSYEEEKPYKRGEGFETHSAWKYHTADELQETTHWGNIAVYSGAGSYQLLAPNKSQTLEIIEHLKSNIWINRATRVVFLDFTMHNANVNLFCIVKLVWEFPATGGVITSSFVNTVKMLRYATSHDYVILVLEFVFVGFTIFYTIEEICKMTMLKCKTYWGNFWSYVDLAILLISYACIGFSIYRHYQIAYQLENILKDEENYENFYWIGFWETQYIDGVAILVFLCWIKLIEFISFNRTMSQLSNTMSRCAKDIGGFAIMFFVVFFAFTQLGYLIFGSQVEDFQSFYSTVFTLLRLILGDFDFRAIEAANRVLGPIFFVTYMFFVFFVLLNMFLAIINETYSEVKSETKVNDEPDFYLMDYLKRGLYRFCSFCCRCKRCEKNAASVDMKLARAQNIIHLDDIRGVLQKSNYTDLEVEMFIARYEMDVDGDQIIDAEEADYFLRSLGGRSSKALNELVEDEISDLQSRVGELETSFSGLSRKIDTLIKKLDTAVKP